ncbi:hypothetical protein JKP88DRAFT_299436 [Tribonema minus]|uniref:Uncharacterized protein n=1 Tax=Tribonema minus TaxID=303371 RepID=A0A835ZBT3_9STRA|nr:hypothetical protein JKP88DRAFT_299436 [Tribonema minus]
MGFIKKGAPKIAAADERRATTPAATPPGTPFSVILAKKKRESADAAACAAAARAQAAAAAAVNKGAVAASHSSGAAGKQGGHWSETTSTNGGGTQSGGGGGSSSKSGASRRVSPRALMRKYRARVKARTGLYLAFALVELIAAGALIIPVELIAAGAFILCIASGYNAVVRNYAASATDAIAGVHEGYTKKVSQMRNLVGSTAYNFDVQAYLKDPTDPARAANAKALVEYIASVYRVEYCNILGSDMRIMMGANNDRTGELFNPEGIVTAARALNGSDSAWTYGRHTYADLLKEGAPISWDRESTLDESFKGGSQYNYKGDGVIRWVAIAINTVDFQTFSIIDPDSSEGFIIMGDVINGKASSTTLTSTTVGGVAAASMTTLTSMIVGGLAAVYTRLTLSLSSLPNLRAFDLITVAVAPIDLRVRSGKASSTTLTSTTVGGLAAVYTRRNDTGAADGAHWLTGSSSVNMGVAAKTGGAHTLLNVIVQGLEGPALPLPPLPLLLRTLRMLLLPLLLRMLLLLLVAVLLLLLLWGGRFSPYSALGAKKDALMDTLFARANTDTRADTRVQPTGGWPELVEPTGGRPELILTRGIAMDASLTVGYVWQQVGYLAGVILVDVFTLCLATFLFLVPLEAMGKRVPLEAMGKRVRNGQRVDVGFLKSLTRRKRLGVVIAAVAAFSLLWGIGIEAANRDNLARVIVTRSKFEPGGTMLSYRQRPDQISRMLSTMQLCTALRGLLAAPSDAALLTFTAHRLTVCEDVMDSEIALLYGANATLLVAPHAPALKGVAWDPNGIVNDTLANGKRYTRTRHALKGVAWDPNGIVNDTLANGKRYTRTEQARAEGRGVGPNGIVNDTLANGKRYTRTRVVRGAARDANGIVRNATANGKRAIMTPAELAQFNGTRNAIMTPAELAQFNGTRKFDQLSSTTGVSALDPSVTGEDVLVRWMAVPMWIGGPTSVGPPSGALLMGDIMNGKTCTLERALLMGDIVNGKTRTLERANKMAGGRGYSAVYFYNSTSQYQMASALMRVKGGLFDLDVPLPETAWLDTLRKSVDWHIDDHFTITKSINFPKYGGKHVVSARCINKNMVYQSYGADVDPRGWDGQPLGDCWGYLIQGLPWCAVAPSLRVSYVWQWVFVAMCVAKLVAMGVLCWRAYLPFRKIVVQNKFVQGAHRTVTSPAAQKDANASATATLTATMQN